MSLSAISRFTARIAVLGVAALLCATAHGRGRVVGRRANRSSLARLANTKFSLDPDKFRVSYLGRPRAYIVTGANASESVRFAASELKLHLDKITGASFAIVEAPPERRKTITIATNPTLDRQEARISFTKYGIALESGAFPEYAVYDFLRDYCGVSWLDPTDAGTVFSKRPTLEVKRKNTKDRPFAKGRTPTGSYAPELWDANTPGWTNYLHVAYPSAFSNRTFSAALDEIARRKQLFLRRMKSGGDVTYACHSFYDWYDRFWDKGSKKFERFRPELFARGYENAKRPPQLCYSNPETLKQAVADVRAYFDNGGTRWGKDVCCLEPMDNDSFCKCAKCASQDNAGRVLPYSEHSDYWFRFVNAVAREIAKSHPDKKISTLAYFSHCGVPSFRLQPNVVVHYCFTCNRIPYTVKKDFEMKMLRGWRSAYRDRPIGLWLYDTFPKERITREAGVHCFPGFFAHVLRDEYQLFALLDVSENIFNCGFVDDYENFLSLRWMWNPWTPLESLEDEYFASYGAAEAPLREFYRVVEERYCTTANYPPKLIATRFHQTSQLAWDVLGTPDVLLRLEQLMCEAERLADTPLAKARVANWREGIWRYIQSGPASRSSTRTRCTCRPRAHGGAFQSAKWQTVTRLRKECPACR